MSDIYESPDSHASSSKGHPPPPAPPTQYPVIHSSDHPNPNTPLVKNKPTEESYDFEEVFEGPSTPALPPKIGDCFQITYETVLKYSYLIVSILLGPILIILFGFLLGLNVFMMNWICSPCLKCFSSWLNKFRKFIASLLQCCLGPYLEILATCFSKIIVRYQKVPHGQPMIV